MFGVLGDEDVECCKISLRAVLSDGYPRAIMMSLTCFAAVRSRGLRLLSFSLRPCLKIPRKCFLGRRLLARHLGGWGVVSFTPPLS
jgi:hypothetical protein